MHQGNLVEKWDQKITQKINIEANIEKNASNKSTLKKTIEGAKTVAFCSNGNTALMGSIVALMNQEILVKE